MTNKVTFTAIVWAIAAAASLIGLSEGGIFHVLQDTVVHDTNSSFAVTYELRDGHVVRDVGYWIGRFLQARIRMDEDRSDGHGGDVCEGAASCNSPCTQARNR